MPSQHTMRRLVGLGSLGVTVAVAVAIAKGGGEGRGGEVRAEVEVEVEVSLKSAGDRRGTAGVSAGEVGSFIG